MKAQVKIQEMFKEDLEELKNRDEQQNNWSRRTVSWKQLSELEDRIVEITAKEQNKEKRMKTDEV